MITNEQIHQITLESLRDWFKKEKWVRISSSGKIAGPCGTSKNKKNPDRCLPKAKAQSLTKGQRAATAAKKKKAGAKGKTVVKNTKKATVKKERLQVENVSTLVDRFFGSAEKAGQKLLKLIKRETKQTIYALKEIAEMVIKKEKPTPAEQKKIVEQLKDFAFLGLLLIKNKFKIFGILYYIIDQSNIADELLKLNETKEAPAGHYFTKSGNLVKGRMSKDAKERGARKSDPKDKQRSKVPPVTQYSEGTDMYEGDKFSMKRFSGPNGIALQVTARKLKGGGFEYIQIDGSDVKEFARAAVHVAQEFEDMDRQIPVNETSNPDDGKAAPFGSGYKPITEMTLEDLKNLTVGLLHEIQQKEDVLQEDDRCTRIAKQKYDTWPSAYASGAVVRCRRGEIWKKKK